MSDPWTAGAFGAGVAFGVVLLALAIRLALRMIERAKKEKDDGT